MALSRSARITLLLVIDILFFFLELVVGYVVGSLALVTDSFHMLNDVMSLVVALYAIKLTGKTADHSRYSYGWQRAEILAALTNGVFLLALCFSVSLQAVERFFNIEDVSHPLLVVIVGSCGLASNIFGFLLFHEHGHSHSHGHSHGNKEINHVHVSHATHTAIDDKPIQDSSTTVRGRTGSYSSMYGHPAATRAAVSQAAQDIAIASPSSHQRNASSSSRSIRMVPDGSVEINIIETPLDSKQDKIESFTIEAPLPSGHSHNHGHSHGSMNMRALMLHVMGDALGNIGVIVTGLIIWLTKWSGRFYLDPAVSIVITIIIFTSALPLVRNASFILLQGVPHTVSLEDVRDSILKVDGVLSVHELHIWQLSESKIVASVHVMASRNHDFMPIAADIRKALHLNGIHSSTIQPEYHYRPAITSEDDLKTSVDSPCLILCPEDQHCDPLENYCCPPPPPSV
ncbi:cation efflux protein [Suillus discolor]|uniref:Cation efflux protein n=1 Tax=Suillus discolor TaxID=1912936 RepID=A0A9P7EW76_9AGAM|nr:cation efflux protein [Suillus discolor]KAG2094245.1 cation efflux protein [Suillus discolor]